MKLAVTTWPEPLSEGAFHGLAGEVVRTIEPHILHPQIQVRVGRRAIRIPLSAVGRIIRGASIPARTQR